jgi:Mrp family chromosome partitioning ATPase
MHFNPQDFDDAYQTPSDNVSAMNHERSQSTSSTASNKPAHRTGRPVVIRPLQPLEGSDQNVRVDSAQAHHVQGPHRRTERLEEYVSWLQQQNQHRLNQPLVEPRPQELKEQQPVKNQVELSPLARSTSPKELQENISFSQSTRVAQPQPVSKSARPIIEFVKKPLEYKQFRQDQAHSGPDSRFSPAPRTSSGQFQLEADLERILRKLESAEEQAKQLAATTGVSSDTTNLQSAFAARPTRKVHPAEFAQPYSEQTAAPPMHPGRADSELLTRAEIIQTISTAIASVLSNQAEPIIEAKIKAHLSQLQLELVPDQEQVYESGIHVQAPNVSSATNSPSTHPSMGGARRFSRSPEIPVTAAAWDVSEFRWPKVTDQMISLGAEAIKQLASTVLDTVSGTRRRVAVTAPDRRAGSTSIAISLARWVAGEGGRVLLVDADLSHPELSSMVGLGPGISWINALSDRRLLQAPAEFIIRSQEAPVCVMPLAFTADRRNRSNEKLFDQLGRLLDPVAFDFDLILLDVGPANQVANELSLGSNLIDTALIVHQDKGFKFNQVQTQLRALDVEQFVFAQNASSEARSNVA